MMNVPVLNSQIFYVNSFDELVSRSFTGTVNAICWSRTPQGNFEEIVYRASSGENITVLEPEALNALELSEGAQLARALLLDDYYLLKAYGAQPALNIIRCYERDDDNPFFPTDVYSYHADRSPLATDTFLCTYYGACSELLPNEQVMQKVLVPEIRDELKKMYNGPDEGFESFLNEHFLDLHYTALPGAIPINLGIGNMWRLAIDHPESKVPPCIHRAPVENANQSRLLMIC